MMASRLVLAGLCLGAGFGISACTTVHHGPDRLVSGYAVAQDCLNRAEGGQTATPQVMIYDPKTGTETHILDARPLDDDGSTEHVMTVQRRDKNQVVAVTADAPIGPDHNGFYCASDGHGEHYSTTYATTTPNPILVGAVAGAIVGNASTHTPEGTRQGAAIGATMGATLDPADSNSVAVGAAAGALLGGNDKNAAVKDAMVGAYIGQQSADKGPFSFFHRGRDGDGHKDDRKHHDDDSNRHHDDDGW